MYRRYLEARPWVFADSVIVKGALPRTRVWSRTQRRHTLQQVQSYLREGDTMRKAVIAAFVVASTSAAAPTTALADSKQALKNQAAGPSASVMPRASVMPPGVSQLGVGRWQVVQGPPSGIYRTFLMDTVTGDTWIVCDTSDGLEAWCPLERLDYLPAESQRNGELVGRWQIVQGPPTGLYRTFLLDSVSGDTWIVCSGTGKREAWCRRDRLSAGARSP